MAILMKWSMRETQSLINDTRKKEKKGKKSYREAKKRERGEGTKNRADW